MLWTSGTQTLSELQVMPVIHIQNLQEVSQDLLQISRKEAELDHTQELVPRMQAPVKAQGGDSDRGPSGIA